MVDTPMITPQGSASGVANIPVPLPANVANIWAPSMDMLDPAAYAVNRANIAEAISQPLYSYAPYPAAGTGQPIVLFQDQVKGTVTLEDTNMQLAGQLGGNQSFLVQSIGIDYLSGTAAARFGAESANGHLVDMFAILRRGYLLFQIGAKPYLTLGPLLQLPVRSHINGVAATADATTAGAALQTMVQVAFSDGPVFSPRPLLIPPSQPFTVSLAWPAGAVVIPSADTTARIGVQLGGTLFRPVQ